jgi:hypothetical protein
MNGNSTQQKRRYPRRTAAVSTMKSLKMGSKEIVKSYKQDVEYPPFRGRVNFVLIRSESGTISGVKQGNLVVVSSNRQIIFIVVHILQLRYR